MHGIMQDRPLAISSLIEHAATFHGSAEIVSKLPDGVIHRTCWGEVRNRTKQLAKALDGLGVRKGDRVATLAWNSFRHLELYFGVSGSGAILHTINPRLASEQIGYIANHAEDGVLFFDNAFAGLVETLAPRLKSVRTYVAMTDRSRMPEVDVPNLICYEDLVSAQICSYDWPEFDEQTASALCYTSGTTGNPKGVLYSHRSTMLHSLMQLSPDTFGFSARTCVLLVVPMFHANAWGMPYSAAMVGAKLVLPGPHLDGRSLYELMRDENVTDCMAVPTVWTTLFQYLDANSDIDPRKLGIKRVGTAGSAAPCSMIERLERDFDARFAQGWGMTETSPIGVMGTLLPKHDGLPAKERTALQAKQGRGVWGVELKIADSHGQPLPWDGATSGHLHVRGPWIASGYYRANDQHTLDGGWFPTGDIGTIDADGYLQLVDRAKDLIKSGGEWISSIDLENAASGYSGVAEAAVIGIHHPKWQERPLLIIVKRPGQDVKKDELMAYLAGQVAKWWLPDDIVFVEDLPHSATGKIQKAKLRERFQNYTLPR